MNLKKLFAIACALLLAVLPLARAENEYENGAVEVLAFLSGGSSLQEWADSELAGGAGGSADFCILAMNNLGLDFDASKYVHALKNELNEGGIANAVTRMRACLALVSCGGMDMLPDGIADESIGKLGVMSYAFGLHMINCGVPSESWTADSVLEGLLSLQLEDGGWAVSGKYSDPDVTAMCLQAIAGCEGNTEVSAAIERAINCLSSMQLNNGGFKSYGKENMESSAQVVQALVALGIDPHSDARFVKNGRTAIDAMQDFRLPDGGYSHLHGGEENRMATLQAFTTFAVLQTGRSVYDLRAVEEAQFKTVFTWKHWACIAIGALGLVSCVLSLLKKRGRIKRLLSIAVVMGVMLAGVGIINIDSSEEYYTVEEITNPAGRVKLGISCVSITGGAENASQPENGVILPATEFAYQEGDTVFDVLTRAVREYDIRMEYEGGSAAYINGINYLYELNYGSLSGWMFSVNGEFPSVGCNSYTVTDGDEIQWLYTTELGEDLK